MTREQWAKRKIKQSNIPNNHFWDKTEKTDRELWVECWCAVASAINCMKPSTANEWADKAMSYLNNKDK